MDMEGIKESVLLVDSHHGIYVPRQFAESIVPENKFLNWPEKEEDLKDLSSPENEAYWDTWDRILNNVTIIGKDGKHWRLCQDEDLFAVIYE